MNRHPIDDATVNRLLSGALSPEDAPPGYAGLAEMIRTASGPATSTELAGQDRIVAAAAAAVLSAPTTRPTTRRNPMLSKLLSAKVAAVAAAAFLGAAGVAAAATGNLPLTSHASTNVPRPGGPGVSSSSSPSKAAAANGKTDHDKDASEDHDGKSGDKGNNGANDDKATFGQCKAFLAGSENGREHKDHSADFKDLIADHGGSVASTTAFCKKVVAAHKDDNDQIDQSGRSSDSEKSSDSDKPTNPASAGSHATTESHTSSLPHHP